MSSICETWLNSTNEHLHEMDGFNAYYVHRPVGSTGGGVAIYVKNKLQSQKLMTSVFVILMLNFVVLRLPFQTL